MYVCVRECVCGVCVCVCVCGCGCVWCVCGVCVCGVCVCGGVCGGGWGGVRATFQRRRFCLSISFHIDHYNVRLFTVGVAMLRYTMSWISRRKTEWKVSFLVKRQNIYIW